MLRTVPGHGRGVLLLGALVCVAISGSVRAHAATLTWELRGPFETCLQSRMEQWINTQAERLANEDPAAGDLDDTDVALWATGAIESCEGQAGRANANSEVRFVRHMAHWREHIDAVAQDIRQRGRAD